MPSEEFDVTALVDCLDEFVRAVSREEIASLSGMMLRRLQEMGPTRSPERNMAVEILSELFGEALADFSGHSGDAHAPGN